MSLTFSADEFYKYVKGKSVAIVGNSTTLLSLPDNGKRIDACDVVIRCNRFSLLPQHQRYVGNRIDVWASSFFTEAMRGVGSLLGQFKPQMAVACIPEGASSRDQTERFINDVSYILPVVRMPENFARSLADRLGKRPTTGCMMTHWITQSPARSLYLSGFTFDPVERLKYYFEGDHRDTGVHNPEAEGKLLREVMNDRIAVDPFLQSWLVD